MTRGDLGIAINNGVPEARCPKTDQGLLAKDICE